MKRLLLLTLALTFASTVFTTQASAQATDWKQIKIPALKDFHPKQPKRIQLPNGMVIFLQEDRELPLIDGIDSHPRRLTLGTCNQDRPARHLRRCLAHRRHKNSNRRSDG